MTLTSLGDFPSLVPEVLTCQWRVYLLFVDLESSSFKLSTSGDGETLILFWSDSRHAIDK